MSTFLILFFVTTRKEQTKDLSVNEKLVMNGLYDLYLSKERCKLITTMSKKMMMMMVFMKMMVSMIMMVIMMMINCKMTVMIMLALMTKNGDDNERSTPSAENSDRNMASMLCVR